MPAGRPTKYKKEFCEQVIQWGKTGMSLHEMALEMDICFDTFNEWRKEKKEFSESVKKAIEFSQGWWERLGRHGASGLQEIQPTVYIFNMKNRFKLDWKDKQEVETTNKHTHSIDYSELTNEELEAIIKEGEG